MAEHIPFLNGKDACRLVNEYYEDSHKVRIHLYQAQEIVGLLSQKLNTRIWLDPSIDGFHNIETRRSTPARPNPWFQYMKQFKNFEEIGVSTNWASLDKTMVREFVSAVLDRCVTFNAAWITVPQVPCPCSSERNRINRILAGATGQWKMDSGFQGRLILPIVITKQDQSNGKTARNLIVKSAHRNFDEAHADGIWIVDESMNDDYGSPTMRSRFKGMISLHEETNERIPSKIRIAGPYWGLNLVLWAKGLVDHPAIGVGSGFKLFFAGGHASTPKVRLALPSLRRRVIRGPHLQDWIEKARGRLGSAHAASAELDAIRKRLATLAHSDIARRQIAQFYRDWLKGIAAEPKDGRSMALFQDLSTAYALGRPLPDLEDEDGPCRRPEAVAEPLMLSCL